MWVIEREPQDFIRFSSVPWKKTNKILKNSKKRTYQKLTWHPLLLSSYFFTPPPPPKLFFPPQISLSLCFLHLLSSFLFRLNKELPKARSFTPSEHSFLITIRELQKQIVCGSLTIFWDL